MSNSLPASGIAATGISVTGEGEASLTPDAAFFDIGVSVMQPTVGAASALAATRARSVIDALHAAGVDAADVATRDYNVYPEHDHSSRQPHPRVIGYRVQNTVTVRVRNVDAVSEIIDQATTAGGDAVIVQNLRFGALDPTAAETAARSAAWQSAQARAQELASLAGVTLGAVRSIEENRGGGPGPMRRMRGAEMAMASAPPMEAGTQAVGVRIDVVFEIER